MVWLAEPLPVLKVVPAWGLSSWFRSAVVSQTDTEVAVVVADVAAAAAWGATRLPAVPATRATAPREAARGLLCWLLNIFERSSFTPCCNKMKQLCNGRAMEESSVVWWCQWSERVPQHGLGGWLMEQGCYRGWWVGLGVWVAVWRRPYGTRAISPRDPSAPAGGACL